MVWLLLVPAAAVMMLAAAVSYAPAHRAAAWFPWAVAGMGAANGVLWVWACRLVPDNRQLFSVSVAWDAVTILAYTALPLAAFGVRLSPTAVVGVGLVVLGACLVKWGG